MRSVVVDTNALIRFLSGEERYRHAFDGYAKILVSTVVVGEYKCGLDASTARGRRQRLALEKFLGKACVECVPIGEKETDWYAEIFRALKRRGTPVPQNDMWIAAVAMSAGAAVLTDDSHFNYVPMLRLA